MAFFLALVAVLAVSCGLPTDSHPRPIRDKAVRDLVSPAPDATSPPQSVGGAQAQVFFVQADHLFAVSVPTNGRLTVDRVLAVLLNGPPRPDAGQDVTTAIPSGTILRKAELARGGRLLVDLSGNIKSIGGSAAKTAYAQLVFTLTGVPGVRSVRFSIAGGAIDAPTDDGALSDVRRENYKPPLNPFRR